MKTKIPPGKPLKSSLYKTYRNRSLAEILIDINMSPLVFAQACGADVKEIYLALHTNKAPRRAGFANNMEFRGRFEHVTGMVWNEVFPQQEQTVHLQEMVYVGLITTPKTEQTPTEVLIHKETLTRLGTFLSSLEKIEKRVIELLYFRSLDVKKCAKKLSLTRTRIYQILKQAINKLQKKFNEAAALERICY